MTTETNQQQPIHWGHLALIVGAALVLVFVTFMKNGFHFSLKATASTTAKPYTYAMALKDAHAELAISDTGTDASEDSSTTAEQLAMIDPMLDQGAVLGASTGTLDSVIPDAADIISPDQLSQIKIKLLDTTSSTQIAKYKDDVAAVESAYSTETILTELQSEDSAMLKKISGQIQPLISALLGVSVPKDLAEYHRYKILYYAELSVLADGYAGVANAADPQDTGMNVFSISDKMTKLSADIEAKYGVQL